MNEAELNAGTFVEEKFISSEILKDEKIEEIFRIIEGQVLKEDFNMTSRANDVETLKSCIIKANDIKNIYTQEQKDFVNHKSALFSKGVTEKAWRDAYDDMSRMIISINEYTNSISYFIMGIEQLMNKLKDFEVQIREHTNQIHEAYNKFIENNKDTLLKLKAIREMIAVKRF